LDYMTYTRWIRDDILDYMTYKFGFPTFWLSVQKKKFIPETWSIDLWCLTPLWTIFQLYRGGGNRSTQMKICRKSLTNLITKCCIEYTLPWARFKLTTLVVVWIDCAGNCKSNYHTITTMTAPDDIIKQVCGFLQVLWFPSPIKMTTAI
jgi:hypothetical protein